MIPLPNSVVRYRIEKTGKEAWEVKIAVGVKWYPASRPDEHSWCVSKLGFLGRMLKGKEEAGGR